MLKYYDKAMCSNNIQHSMTEGTKQQHTTNREIDLKKCKIKHKTVCVYKFSCMDVGGSGWSALGRMGKSFMHLYIYIGK